MLRGNAIVIDFETPLIDITSSYFNIYFVEKRNNLQAEGVSGRVELVFEEIFTQYKRLKCLFVALQKNFA